MPLGRAMARGASAPLPSPLKVLDKRKVYPARGQLWMIAGAPGSGKTTLAMIMAVATGVPTLYVSADSDEATMSARMASHLTGHSYANVREAQAHGLFGELYGPEVAKPKIRWVFDPSEPSVEDLANALTAYRELWGIYPAILVVDNLMNMATSAGNEWLELRAIMKDLHYLARRTKVCVWVLHHTSEGDERWITSAPPRSAIQGKLAQLPEVILTLGNDSEGVVWMGIVKNRHGESDPLAKNAIRIVVDFGHMKVFDPLGA